MKKFAAWVALVMTVLCGCDNRKSIQLSDATLPSSLSLPVPAKARRLELRIFGQLEGNAILSASHLQPQNLSGTFDTRITQEWSETNCVLAYTPRNVKSGRVTIEYKFRAQ